MAASRPSAGVRTEERVGFWFFCMNIFPEHVWCRPRAEAGTDGDAFIHAVTVNGTAMKTADRVPKPEALNRTGGSVICREDTLCVAQGVLPHIKSGSSGTSGSRAAG